MMIRLQGRVSVLTPHTALHIVQGAALYKPLPTGYGLAAIVGLNEPQTAKVVASVNNKERPVFVANINAPRQIVVAGEIQGMRNVLRPALERGARKAELLAVATLSRRLLLQPAAESLRARGTAYPALTWNTIVRPSRCRLRLMRCILEELALTAQASRSGHVIRRQDIPRAPQRLPRALTEHQSSRSCSDVMICGQCLRAAAPYRNASI
jgi:malonyl CoA-acyl carrier protein transacylase